MINFGFYFHVLVEIKKGEKGGDVIEDVGKKLTKHWWSVSMNIANKQIGFGKTWNLFLNGSTTEVFNKSK